MKTTIILKADKEIKEKAQKVAKKLGLTLSAVINASLTQFVKDEAVSFSTAPRMTARLEKLVGEARRDYKTGRNMSPEFTSAKDAIKWLNSK